MPINKMYKFGIPQFTPCQAIVCATGPLCFVVEGPPGAGKIVIECEEGQAPDIAAVGTLSYKERRYSWETR